MRTIFFQIISGILGLWLAKQFIFGVEITGHSPYTTLLFAGFTLGLVNLIIKPILKFITLPLRMLTFGLFGLVINIMMVWLVDLFFDQLKIEGIVPLLWTTLIIWGLAFLLPLFFRQGGSE